MEGLFEGLREEWTVFVEHLPRLVIATVVFAAIVGLGYVARSFVPRLMSRGDARRTHQPFFRSLTLAVFVVAGAVVFLDLLGLEGAAAGLVAGGGVTAIVLGFAFKEIGENFLAGFFLAFSRPFEVGDLIRSGEFEGEVRAVELRCTHVRTADATDVWLPNSQLFTQPLVNYTRDGLRRPTVTVGIDYGDDPNRALEIVLEATRTTPGVLEKHPPRAFIGSLDAQFVVLQVVFWVDTFDRSRPMATVRSDVQARIRAALREAGFTFSADVTTNVAVRSEDGSKP